MGDGYKLGEVIKNKCREKRSLRNEIWNILSLGKWERISRGYRRKVVSKVEGKLGVLCFGN